MKTITIEGAEDYASIDFDLLQKCIQRAVLWAPGQEGYSATIYLDNGAAIEGWKEYLIVIMKDGVRNYTIAGIRRGPGCSLEFHS